MAMKMFFKRFIVCLVLSLFILASHGWSALVNFSDAQVVAQRWLNRIVNIYGDWGGSKQPSIKDSAEIRGKDGELLGYKFSIHPSGHIVVPRISQLAAVKSYSTTEDFDVNDPRKESYSALIKDALGATLDALKDRYGSLEAIPDQDLGILARHPSWKELLEDYLPGDSISVETNWGPFLESTWHQGPPFNNYCPAGDTLCTSCPSPTVVGCVATAASQIANYWKYPLKGTGTKIYTWDGDDSCGHTPIPQPLSATYSDEYDWDNILNSYSGSYNSTQAAAVAELCYEMGVAFEMDYGVCSSGANTSDAQTVFPTYFKYANVIQKKDRSSYTTATAWFNYVIKPEFDSYLPRPIQYRIYGHSIVCDGARARDGTTQYVHMNYGWGGSHDAWYAVDNLYCSGSGCTPNVEYAMVGIQPLNRLYNYAVGNDKKIYYQYITYSGSLGPWSYVSGGTTDATPAVAVYRNRQYMVVKGNGSETLWVNSRSGKGWRYASGWTSISGATSAAPAIASFNNYLYLAVKGGGSNTNIYYRYMTSSGSWSSWFTLSGATNHSPALISFNNKLYIFVRGTNGGIYYRSMDASGSWGSWQTIPGSTSHEPAVAVYNNRLYVAVKGSSGNAIYYGYLNASNTWSGWSILSGGTDRAPRLTVMPQTNRMYIIVKGAGSSNIYQRYYDGTTWSSWQVMGGATQLSPVQGVHYFYDPWESP